jgi:hypothetical protein
MESKNRVSAADSSRVPSKNRNFRMLQFRRSDLLGLAVSGVDPRPGLTGIGAIIEFRKAKLSIEMAACKHD